MATLNDAELKHRLEHGVWLDEIDRSYRDWRAASNADKPQYLLSGMMLTWAEGWRMTNPNDFSPAVHTYISRSVQAQAAKSSAEREAKTVEVQRRDRVYQQILLLMALFAIVLLAPAAIRQSLVGPEQVAVAPTPEPAPAAPPVAKAAAITVTEEPAASLTRVTPVDSWASARLFDRARQVRGSSQLGPLFALEAIAARATPGDINHANAKWPQAVLSLTAEFTRLETAHALLPRSNDSTVTVDICDNRRLSVRSERGDVTVADLGRGTAQAPAGIAELSLLPAALDRACRIGLASNLDYEVMLVSFDDPTGVPQRIGGHDAPIVSASFSADASRAVTVSRDGVAKVWDIASTRMVRAFTSPDDLLAGATLSPDGTMIVTWTDRPGARLWQVATGASIGQLSGHESRLIDAQFVDAGRKLLTTSIDGTAMMWRTEPLERLASLRPRGGSIVKAWATGDASRIIAHLDGDRVQVWTVGAAAAPLADLSPGDGKVRLVAADPAGKLVATADSAGVTTVWDVTTGARLLTLNQDAVPLKALMIADDAASVIGIAETGTLSWALPRSLDSAAAMLVALGGCADQDTRSAQKLTSKPPAACPNAATDSTETE